MAKKGPKTASSKSPPAQPKGSVPVGRGKSGGGVTPAGPSQMGKGKKGK